MRNSGLTVDNDSCQAARAWMERYHGLGHALALWFYAEDPAQSGHFAREGFNERDDEHHLAHVRACPDCTDWIHSEVGATVMRRQYRLLQYCCSQLFATVEEPRSGRLGLKLSYYSPGHYEGAHNWRLTLRDHKEIDESLLVNYCPYCGQQIRAARDEPD